MRIDIALFDGVDELDAVGPYEVLASAAGNLDGWHVRLVALPGRQASATGAHGLALAAHGRAGEACDVLVVPGGGWGRPEGPGVRAELRDGTLAALAARAHGEGAVVASVCTGAMLLAAAGLLAGRPATTHASARDDLSAAGARLVDARVVDDGDVITAAGVTSGIDLALWLVERWAGAAVAERGARRLEYVRADVARTGRGGRS